MQCLIVTKFCKLGCIDCRMEIGRYHHLQIPKPVSFWEISTTFSLLIMPMEEVGICLEIETSQVESEAKRQEKKT